MADIQNTLTTDKSCSLWSKVPLKDFCKKCTKKNIGKKNNTVFTNSAIHGVIKQSDYFEKDVANSENTDSYYVVHPEDFIYNPRISENAPYGPIRTNETEEYGVVSPLYFVFRLVDKKVANYDYLKYYFASSSWHRYVYSIGNNGARSDRMNISDADFMAMPVALPPLEEQRRIAEILGCCDRVIALKKELIAEKKKQKKSLMQKLLNPDSGFRLPGFSGKWKKFRISEICKIESGGTPATADEQCWNGDIFWCTPSDITNAGKYISHTPQKITPKGLDTSSATLLPTGSVIMCSRASIGPRCITKVPMATNQGFKSFICSDLLYNEFWYYFIDTILEDLYKMASGNTFKEVSKNSIATYLVTIPSNIAEQQAIADILSAADKEIDLLEQELAQQEQKKKSLMQLLLTGIVRV